MAANRALAAVVELPGVRAGAEIQADRVVVVEAVEIPGGPVVVVAAALPVVQAVVVAAVEIPGCLVVQVDQVGVAEAPPPPVPPPPPDIAVVPEPNSVLLLLAAVLAIGGTHYWKSKQR